MAKARHSSRRGGGGFAIPRKVKWTPDSPAQMEANIVAKAARASAKAAAEAEKAARLASEPVREGPSKKERKRMALRKYLLSTKKIEQTDLPVAKLMKTKFPVQEALIDVQDEVEMRNMFHAQGTDGFYSKYFKASKFRFKYLLSVEGTPVCQIVKVQV